MLCLLRLVTMRGQTMTLFTKSQLFLGVSTNGPMAKTWSSDREETAMIPREKGLPEPFCGLPRPGRLAQLVDILSHGHVLG